MKKILALATLALCFSSCDSDNVEIPHTDPPNIIVGKWKMKNNIVVSGTDKTTVIQEYLPDDCKRKGTYEFTFDGKYIVDDYNSIGSNCVQSSATRDYDYNTSNKTLKIGGQTAEVLELTIDSLTVLVFDDYDHNSDGVKDYLKYIYYR